MQNIDLFELFATCFGLLPTIAQRVTGFYRIGDATHCIVLARFSENFPGTKTDSLTSKFGVASSLKLCNCSLGLDFLIAIVNSQL